MKKLLPVIVCVLAVSSMNAQIKGDPQMKGTLQQLSASKFSSTLSPELQRLHEKYGDGLQVRRLSKEQSSSADALENLMQIHGEKVLVDFTVKDNINAAKAELQRIGVTITASYGRVISGYVSINTLLQVEAITTIKYARPSYKPMRQPIGESISSERIIKFPSRPEPSSVKPVMSQGDTAQLSWLARKKYNLDGNGIKVGIISDSYNNLGTAGIGITHGELPGTGNPLGYTGPVQVLEDLDSGGTDEGRQMMEIVHDVAPGAKLAFRTAYNGAADFAQGIQDLADSGCKIIADDIAYLDEPFFQDGIIAQSVDLAKKKGVTYFSAAGNFSLRSYESDYKPTNAEPLGPGMGTAHNFSAPSDPPRYTQPLLIRPGAAMIIGFQWSAPSLAASGVGTASDFDIYLTDVNGKVVAKSASDNIKSGEPLEVFGYYNPTKDSIFFVVILKYAGPDPARLKYILYDYNSAFYITTPAIPGIFAPTVVGHTKAEGAISTGAAPYFKTQPYGIDTPVVEHFSSVGGVANYFDTGGNAIPPLIRQKPNIIAPDDGNVSFSYHGGQDIAQDPDAFPNFLGTSAAAPHAAGVAALMIEAQRLHSITPDQIKEALEETATDMDDVYTNGFDKGFDFNTGNGFINAEKAVEKVKFSYLYVRKLELSPLCSGNPDMVRNWKITNPNPFPLSVEWFVERSNQHGTFIVPPGDTSFTTSTVTYYTIPAPNVAIIKWRDNFYIDHVSAEFSTRARCGTSEIVDAFSDKLISPSSLPGNKGNATNLAEVYPNPSSNTFRLYLSLADKQSTSIELFSVDGKKLQSKIVEQSNGVFDIDATGYKPGIYLLNVKQGSFTKTIKLVKK